jgi:hypothetical protein
MEYYAGGRIRTYEGTKHTGFLNPDFNLSGERPTS